MIKQYFKQAWQLIKQHKLFSAIYIAGTALGISMVMIMAILNYVKTADISPEINRSRLLYVKSVSMSPVDTLRFKYTNSGQLSYKAAKEFFIPLKTPERVSVMMENNDFASLPDNENLVKVKNKGVDTNYWKIFQFRFIKGKPFSEADHAGDGEAENEHRALGSLGQILCCPLVGLLDQTPGQPVLVHRIILQFLAQKIGDQGAQENGQETAGDGDQQQLDVIDPLLLQFGGEKDHRRRDGRGGDGNLRGHGGDGQRSRRPDTGPLGHLGDHRQGHEGGMAGAGKHGHHIGDDRRQEGDVLRLAFQHPLGQLDQVVEPPRFLHGGDGGNHPHDDENDVGGDGARLDPEDHSQHQHAEAAGKTDTDAAEPRPQPYEEQHHQQFNYPHILSPPGRVVIALSASCRSPPKSPHPFTGRTVRVSRL